PAQFALRLLDGEGRCAAWGSEAECVNREIVIWEERCGGMMSWGEGLLVLRCLRLRRAGEDQHGNVVHPIICKGPVRGGIRRQGGKIARIGDGEAATAIVQEHSDRLLLARSGDDEVGKIVAVHVLRRDL